jgi:hypothetical protein
MRLGDQAKLTTDLEPGLADNDFDEQHGLHGLAKGRPGL